MSSGFMNKVKNFVGLNAYLDDEIDVLREIEYGDEEYSCPIPSQMETEVSKKGKSNLKIVNHPSSSAYEVLVVEPKAFDESLELVNSLRERKTIVLNLHLLDSEQSQRVVDFLSGATHALDGHQQRIGDGVFIFTPSNVTVSAESTKSKAIADAFWNHPQ